MSDDLRVPMLESCPACANDVSTMATSCPRCGHPGPAARPDEQRRARIGRLLLLAFIGLTVWGISRGYAGLAFFFTLPALVAFFVSLRYRRVAVIGGRAVMAIVGLFVVLTLLDP